MSPACRRSCTPYRGTAKLKRPATTRPGTRAPTAPERVTPARTAPGLPPAGSPRIAWSAASSRSRSLRNNRDRTFLFGNIGGSGGRFAAAAMRGAGLDARFVGITSPAALDRARQGCSGKECLPYQLIWGTLAEYLEGASDTLGADGVVFVSIGRGFQSCRPNLFPVAQQIQLERHGYAGAVEVADFTLLFEDWSLTSAVWIASAAADLLNMMRFYHYAGESRRGASEALYHAYADRLEALLATPRLTGKVKGLNDARALLTRCEALIASAAAEFAALERGDGRDGRDDGRESPPSFCAATSTCASMSGATTISSASSQTRACASSSSPSARSSSCSPCATRATTASPRAWAPNAWRRSSSCATWSSACWASPGPTSPGCSGTTSATYGRPASRCSTGTRSARPSRRSAAPCSPRATQPINGVVVVSPRGCGPALVSEAQLRRGAEFPLLFVYNDGDPVDEARLAGFAWRLRAREPRATA